MFISQNITFQSCRTILLLKTSELPFFTNSICVFAILTIIVLHFSSSNVLCPCISICNFYYGCNTSFHTFYSTKLPCIIGIIINFLIHIFIIFFRIILEFIVFSRFVFFSLAIILLSCVFVNILHFSCLFFTNCNDYNLSAGSAFFRVHTNIDKDGDCLQSNNNDSLNDLWLHFATFFFFLKFWFNNGSNTKLRFLVILIISAMLFLHKHIKTPEHNEAIRSCSKHEFFTFDCIDTCENIQSSGTQLTINHFSFSKLKYKNLNSFSQLLLLL